MTKEQFYFLAENSAKYAGVKFNYRQFIPIMARYAFTFGFFEGVGVSEANKERVILAACGHRIAIPFQNVDLPKL